MKPNKTIIGIAKSYGFDNYEKVGEWKGYTIYSPYNNDGKMRFIGQPVFILSKGNETRVAMKEEWRLFIQTIKD